MKRRVLYFHGFASSPRSQKVEALRKLLGPDVVLEVPDLNVPSFERLRFDSMAARGVERGRANPPKAIVGSSLGALVALEVVRRGIHAPAVLIAPGLGVGKRWVSRIPPGDPVSVFNYERNAHASIHRAFFDEMNGVEPETETPVMPVTVIMGRNDETVPFDLVRSVWEEWERSGKLRSGSRFVEIPEGDHSLVAYVDVIAREIRTRVIV